MRPPLPALAAALALLAAPTTAQQDVRPDDPALLAGLAARSIGPAGMSGRVTAIDGVESDPNRLWLGTATGGLWRSVDGGLTWTPVFDDQPCLSIGAIAIDQTRPEVVWVGTGEGNPRNSASVGKGVFRTRDGGATWEHLGLEGTEKIHRLLLDPRDPDVAWAAAMGPTWSDGAERGVFKTTDGGRSWERVLFVDEGTGCADLALDPRNPDKLFAAMWDHRREPWSFRSGGPGSGLYLTRDGGANWECLDDAHGLPKGELGRIGLGIARSDPEVVYALVEAKENALLRSDDGGRSFRTVRSGNEVAQRPFYYCDIRVDPQDPDRVYDLASIVTVSDDGGRSFRPLIPWSLVHPDHHAMWIAPRDPRLIVEGNDGGAAISRDRGRTWRFVRNLPLAQFYHLAVDDETPYNVYGGMQDNGSWRGPNTVWENGGVRNHHWQEVGFGDGFATLPIRGHATVGYAMSQGGALMRWELETGERKLIRPDAPEGVELRFNWNAGIALDPVEPHTVYYGSQFVHRSRDRGETWEVISPDLTTDREEWQRQDESGGLTPDVTAAENFCSILTIAPSPIDSDVIWVGTDDGRLHVTRDGGASWTSVEANLYGVPANTWIPHVEASKFESGAAFVVLDGHRRGDWTPYVQRTTDYGRSWTSLASGEIDGYVHVLEQDPVDPELLFVGTEFGLFVSQDGGRGWFRWTHGLPNAPVRALVVQPRESDLVIGTFGRAAYVIDDIGPLRSTNAPEPDTALHLYPVPETIQHRVRQTGESRFPGSEEFRGAVEPYGAAISFWAWGEGLPHPDDERERARPKTSEGSAASTDGDGEDGGGDEPPTTVTIELQDEAGETLRTLEHEAHLGLNRLRWDLRRKAWDRVRGDDGEEEEESGGDRPGDEVLPGEYRAVLKLGDATASGRVRVLADPRSDAPLDERRAKRRALERAGAVSEAVAAAVRRLAAAREDVGVVVALAQRAKKDADEERGAALDELIEAGDALKESLKAADERLRGPREEKGIRRRRDTVLARLGEARWGLGSSWDAPTAAQLAALALAERTLEEASAEVERVLGEELAAFRERFEASGLRLLEPGSGRDD